MLLTKTRKVIFQLQKIKAIDKSTFFTGNNGAKRSRDVADYKIPSSEI